MDLFCYSRKMSRFMLMDGRQRESALNEMTHNGATRAAPGKLCIVYTVKK